MNVVIAIIIIVVVVIIIIIIIIIIITLETCWISLHFVLLRLQKLLNTYCFVLPNIPGGTCQPQVRGRKVGVIDLWTGEVQGYSRGGGDET